MGGLRRPKIKGCAKRGFAREGGFPNDSGNFLPDLREILSMAAPGGSAPAGEAYSGPKNRMLNIQGISPMVDEGLLTEIFGAFGAIVSCKIVHETTGVVGYADFSDYASARLPPPPLSATPPLVSYMTICIPRQCCHPGRGSRATHRPWTS